VRELTLVSFNTHYGLLSPREHSTPYDLAAALGELGEPDVLVIQEVWRPEGGTAVVDEYGSAHGYARHDLTLGRATLRTRWPHAAPDGEGTVGTAVLTRLPATVVGRPAVGPTRGDPFPDRRVLHLEVDLGDTMLDLVGVHLTSRLPFGPPIQLRRLARVLPPSERPAIVAGDCNFWGPPAAMLMRGWRRTVRGRTWPASRPHSQIDHVFVRGPIHALETAVLPPLGSDHRAVRVRLRVY